MQLLLPVPAAFSGCILSGLWIAQACPVNVEDIFPLCLIQSPACKTGAFRFSGQFVLSREVHFLRNAFLF